jgi:hypothetical protein
MSLKIFSNCAFNDKTILSYFYAIFKQWLQKDKNPYTCFSFIRLNPNFYDMYIIYSQ